MGSACKVRPQTDLQRPIGTVGTGAVLRRITVF